MGERNTLSALGDRAIQVFERDDVFAAELFALAARELGSGRKPSEVASDLGIEEREITDLLALVPEFRDLVDLYFAAWTRQSMGSIQRAVDKALDEESMNEGLSRLVGAIGKFHREVRVHEREIDRRRATVKEKTVPKKAVSVSVEDIVVEESDIKSMDRDEPLIKEDDFDLKVVTDEE